MAYSPKYLKIVELLQRRFSSGEVLPGDVLPGEIVLSQELGVSRRTLRNALQVLEDDGFIIRKKGVGSVLAPGNMHRRRRRSDVAIVYSAAPEAEHNYDFLLRRSMLADGIIRGMASKGHWLRIVPLAKENFRETCEELFRKGIDGFIFPGVQTDTLDLLHEIVRRKQPHVILESALNLPGANIVTTDDYQAGYDMIKMLLDENIKDISVIGGLFKSEFRNSANRRRFTGALQCFKDNHVSINDQFVAALEENDDNLPPGMERQLLAKLIRRMLAEVTMPRTVVLSSLTVADVFIDEAEAAGFDALKDFRLLTFRGSSNWGDVKNLQEVIDMESFGCDMTQYLHQAVEILDVYLNDPGYRPGRKLIPMQYLPGSCAPENVILKWQIS